MFLIEEFMQGHCSEVTLMALMAGQGTPTEWQGGAAHWTHWFLLHSAGGTDWVVDSRAVALTEL